MNLRKMMFRILKSNDYNNIESKYYEIKNNIHDASTLNKEKLNSFLTHANQSSNYYRNLNKSRIEDYPILTKEILKRNIDSIITVEKADLVNYPFMTTSGSYGTPFKFHVSKEKRIYQQAEVLYFGLLSGFDIGTRHIYSRVINPTIKSQLFKNQFVLKPEKIDREWIINSIKYIQKVKPEVIISYPSTLNNIAIFMQNYNVPIFNVKGIITIGEGLKDEARDNIRKAFGVEPYSRYSTEELGVLGNNYGKGTKMIVNQVNYLIEILDEYNNPVKEGEIGKVIVTDFNSHITPLIRYDTGDLAKVSRYKNGLLYEIDGLQGRKIETIQTTNGASITPFTVNSIMRTYEDVLQFQFIQHNQNSYELKVLPLSDNNHEDYGEAIEKLKKILGKNAYITLSIVSEIPTLKSGKRPYIINNFRRE